MSEDKRTKGWFALGMGLILAGGAIYGLLMVLGMTFAVGVAAGEAGAPVFAVLLIPGLIAVGFLILIAKVIVDRVGNDEDDYYSKNVDQ